MASWDIGGVLFDMDGVLFDTEVIGLGISQQLLAEAGMVMERDFYVQLMGATYHYYAGLMNERFGQDFDVMAYKDEWHRRMDTLLDGGSVPVKPGAVALLAQLKEAGYRVAVASSSPAARIEKNLAATGLREYFSATVGGDSIKKGKPHPEIFETAAAALGLPPHRCMAVEDSLNGVRSASAAGCFTVLVPDLLQPNDEMQALCQGVVPELSAIMPLLATLN